jgi:hypothetical protein
VITQGVVMCMLCAASSQLLLMIHCHFTVLLSCIISVQRISAQRHDKLYVFEATPRQQGAQGGSTPLGGGQGKGSPLVRILINSCFSCACRLTCRTRKELCKAAARHLLLLNAWASMTHLWATIRGISLPATNSPSRAYN